MKLQRQLCFARFAFSLWYKSI